MATKKSPQKAAPKLPSINARIDRLIPTEGDGVRAIASVNIGGAFAAHGFKVYESEEKGLSVLNPSSKYQKDGKNQYSDVIHAVTPEAVPPLTMQFSMPMSRSSRRNRARISTRIRTKISAKDRRCRNFLRNFPIVAGLSEKYRYPVG